MRLDKHLLQSGMVSSRNEALKLIKSDSIKVNGVIESVPHTDITTQTVEIINPLRFVSRAGEKLDHAITMFNLNLNNKVVLDVGTSTGGFADVCLQNGVKKIYCIDVGTDQIHSKIKQDTRVTCLEKTNVKDLTRTLIPDTLDLVVSDLSFISSKYMFEAIIKLQLQHGADIISLVKPQFELSKEIISKHDAYITDPRLHQQAIDHVTHYAEAANLKVMRVIPSPITGAKKHNKEFIIWCKYE